MYLYNGSMMNDDVSFLIDSKVTTYTNYIDKILGLRPTMHKS